MQPQKCKATEIIIEPVELTKELVEQKINQELPDLNRTRGQELRINLEVQSPIREMERPRDNIFDVLDPRGKSPEPVMHKRLTEHSNRPALFDYKSGRMSPAEYEGVRRSNGVVSGDYPHMHDHTEAWRVITSPGRPDPVVRHRKRVEWDHVNSVLK